VLVVAKPDFIYWISFVYILEHSELVAGALLPENKTKILATVVELLIDILLVVGSEGLLGLVKRIRFAKIGNEL